MFESHQDTRGGRQLGVDWLGQSIKPVSGASSCGQLSPDIMQLFSSVGLRVLVVCAHYFTYTLGRDEKLFI